MARKISTVYKVVRVQNGALVSVMVGSLPRTWAVTYRPDRWVAPQHTNSLLFAFAAKDRALRFRPYAPFEVWKADAEVVTKRGGFWQVTNGFAWMASSFYHAHTLSSFWRRKTKPATPRQTPWGTIGCRRIRLVRRVR